MEPRSHYRTAPVFACVLFGVSAVGSAYPIAPRSLWDLAFESERVVVARVEGVSHRVAGDDHFETSVARLRVLETWKGTSMPAVEVTFTEGLICPAPDRYIEGETVLAFLESGQARLSRMADSKSRQELADKWSGRWFTVALSYGTLYPEPEELPVFRQLVAEALKLQSRGPVPDADRKHWLVKAASNPATRWHGLYDLMRNADPIHSYYDHRPAQADLAASLTGEERATLADAFVKAPLLDHTVPMMLRVLANHPDSQVDLVGLAVVDTALAEEEVPFWVHEAMPLVRARFGEVPKPPKRARNKKDCDLGADPLLRSIERTDAETRRAWSQARERLGLPSVALLPHLARRIRGVGATTPP